jgi:hypothetical protein
MKNLLLLTTLLMVFCNSPKMSISLLPCLESAACIENGKFTTYDGKHPFFPPCILIKVGENYMPEHVGMVQSGPDEDTNFVFETVAENCYEFQYDLNTWPPTVKYFGSLIRREFPQYLTKATVHSTTEAKEVIPKYYAYLWGYYWDPSVQRNFYVVGIYKLNKCGEKGIGKPKSSYEKYE